MAKLYFYFGAMNSGKSLSLLSNVYNYEQQNKNVLLLKPTFDVRSGEGLIKSRVGLQHKATEFNDNNNLITIVENYKVITGATPDCVFVDEVHFATKEHIKQLVSIVDDLEINVICYGLKNSYTGELFDSIKVLLAEANSVYEIKSSCEFCNSKATHHLRVVDGKIIRGGEQNIVGDIQGEEKYISVCRKHWYLPLMNV
ncbi:thymidine kinase [Clostridium sp. 1001283B150210_160208_E6]|uniref:thymidine kinase n=1 Tax=Clostridium sp. 1001283B150210_160208_E6 TaxID=2787129 RepID=UPI0018AC6774|nr:thymidine kinase [Clostridium sp. 1001283B150210_160208_E6]